MKAYYKNKRILITGGVGSIGSYLLERLLPFKPKVIRVFDNNEYKLFELSQRKNPRIRPLLGDIRDYDRLKKAMENIDVVFHAAALKHVELSEFNPFEAVKTNVLGTQNVLQVAVENKVDRVIVISTDKAVNPISTMGATKLLAEKLAVSAAYQKGSNKTKFAVVRFGNVLGSNGSVVPIWIDQIKNHQPITITDTKMTRFIMLPNHATDLILKASAEANDGEVFILKMSSVRVEDLARALIKLYSEKYGINAAQIPIKVIGSKLGEKLHEELISEQELNCLYESKDMYIVLPRSELMGLKMIQSPNIFKKVKSDTVYSSSTNKYLSQNEIIALLEETKIV